MTIPWSLEYAWAFHAAAWVLWLIAGIGLYIALLRDRSRGRRRCPKCWYDMAGVPGLKCPECGREARTERRLFSTRRRWRLATLFAALALLGLTSYRAPHALRYGPWAAIPIPILNFVLSFWEEDAKVAYEAHKLPIIASMGWPGAAPGAAAPALPAPNDWDELLAAWWAGKKLNFGQPYDQETWVALSVIVALKGNGRPAMPAVLAYTGIEREYVIQSIGTMSATIPEAFAALERIASTSEIPSDRDSAFTAAISNISIPADRNAFLQRCLSNDDSDYIRRAAASHLAANGQFTSGEALRRLAGTDDSIRCGIIEGLAQGGARYPWLTPELLRGVGPEQSEQVRKVFITRATEFGPLNADWNEPIVLLLNDVNSDIRRAAVQAVSLLEASPLPAPVVDAMVERTSDPVRSVALEAARATMRRAESFAHRQIQHAWEALAQHQPDEVRELSSSWNLPALHAILETDFIYIRRIAARRLIDGAANDRERLDRILSLQTNDRDAQIRALCSGLLGELIIQSDRITPALVHAGLHDPDRSVRAVALRAAENRRDSDAELVEALIEALKDPSPEVVLAAANSLARLGPRAAAAHGALTATADHPDANARTAIADALRKIQAE